jgi:hypothetical protein
VLIEAIKGLPLDAYTVSLYGMVAPEKRSYANRLREETRGLPVRFYGSYPHDQLVAILSQHDVLVMPMIWEETFSILTREALMAGVPVVAARRGALPEAVQDGVNGLLFEPESAEDLRRCLLRLMTEPGLIDRLRVVNPHVKTMDEYAKEIEDVYVAICSDSSRLRVLRQQLVAQAQAWTLLQQEAERLRVEIAELRTQHAALLEQRDSLAAEKVATEHERDSALETARELENILKAREDQLQERATQLEAIYASTTWKLYRGYAALTGAARRLLNK